ncbi:WYL domain-containing protein [Robinsoniella peoriensis]
MVLFHEIYSCYYHTVSKILSASVRGSLTESEMLTLIKEYAFAESHLAIIPALKNENWQLVDEKLQTPLVHQPSTGLTTLQKRWLKAISLDPRIRLFSVDFTILEDVEPLFTPEDYVVFDNYHDGDDYENEHYIRIFQVLQKAIHAHKKVLIQYSSRKNNQRTISCTPYQFEYSEKDDKFRIRILGCRYANILNVSRIQECDILDEEGIPLRESRNIISDYLIMELLDERNALERVMLHFAHFEKEALRISEQKYRIKIYYERDDETEMLIRVLSFGPFVKVTEPEHFVDLIKKRLLMQKSCGLK